MEPTPDQPKTIEDFIVEVEKDWQESDYIPASDLSYDEINKWCIEKAAECRYNKYWLKEKEKQYQKYFDLNEMHYNLSVELEKQLDYFKQQQQSSDAVEFAEWIMSESDKWKLMRKYNHWIYKFNDDFSDNISTQQLYEQFKQRNV